MRLDRFITLNVARPLVSVKAGFSPSPLWGEGRGEVLPVLMYHSISTEPENGTLAYYRTATSPAVFREHMALLKSSGYQGVDLSTGLAWLGQKAESRKQKAETGPAPSPFQLSAFNSQLLKPVVLTFDDGYRDFHTDAVPVLAEFGFTATMYLPTAFIHEERRAFKGTDCMTWSEVRESQKCGMQFGAHTVSHAKLYELTWLQIESELSNSKSEIEQQLGSPVANFAYPYAFPQVDTAFCSRFREVLAGSGYQSCVTTIAGRVAPGADPFTLRRLPVNGADDPVLFRAKLAGYYDWMEPAQRAAKRFKRILANGSRNPALDEDREKS